jgi:hypothetical protein
LLEVCRNFIRPSSEFVFSVFIAGLRIRALDEETLTSAVRLVIDKVHNIFSLQGDCLEHIPKEDIRTITRLQIKENETPEEYANVILFNGSCIQTKANCFGPQFERIKNEVQRAFKGRVRIENRKFKG